MFANLAKHTAVKPGATDAAFCRFCDFVLDTFTFPSRLQFAALVCDYLCKMK